MTQLKPKDIPIEDRVYFELHNRDGRMGKRIIEAILLIRSIVSWGCEKIYDTPCTKKENQWPKGRNFILLILNFFEDDPDRNEALNVKEYESRWKGEINEGKEGSFQVPILIWKGNLYGMSFKNSNKWRCFSDFGEMTKHKISNSEALKSESSYVKAGAPTEIGPKILIKAIKNLCGNDRSNWRASMFDVCLHFLESGRNTLIQDEVEASFTFDAGNLNWMNESRFLKSESADLIEEWKKMSSSLALSYHGAGWDALGTMAALRIDSVDKCESILGVVKYLEFSDQEIKKHKNAKAKESTRKQVADQDVESDRGGSSSKGEKGDGSGGAGHGEKEIAGEGNKSGGWNSSGDEGSKRQGNKEKKRKDLMSRDVSIYKSQASAREQFAAPKCKVVIVADPANTGTLIIKEFAPSILEKNISCANHSSSKYQNVNHTIMKSKSGEKVVRDDAWLNGNFITAVQRRGAAIIKARKISSSLFASSACNHTCDWVFGTPEEHVHCFRDIISRMVQNGSKEISESIDKIQSLNCSKSFPFWYFTRSKLPDALELNALGEFLSEQIGDFYEVPPDEEWEKLWRQCELADIVYQINKRAYDIKRPTANLFLTHLQEIPAYIGQGSTNSIAAFLDPRFIIYVGFCLCDESRATLVIRNICKLNDDGCSAQFDGKNYLLGNPSPYSESNFNSDSYYERDENEDQEAEDEEDTEADERDEDDERTEKLAKETCITMLGKLNVVHENCQSMQSMYHKPQKTDLVHLDVYLARAVLPWVEGFSVL